MDKEAVWGLLARLGLRGGQLLSSALRARGGLKGAKSLVKNPRVRKAARAAETASNVSMLMPRSSAPAPQQTEQYMTQMYPR